MIILSFNANSNLSFEHFNNNHKKDYISEPLNWNRIFDFLWFWVIPCRSIHHKNVSCEILYIFTQISNAQLQNLMRFSKILCSIVLLILLKLLWIYMKRLYNFMKSKFGSQRDQRKPVNLQKYLIQMPSL